jgi:Alr-MurF fusion protein
MSSEPSYSFQKLLTIIGGQGHGSPSEDLNIKYLLTDSRQLMAPGATIFFAIQTKNNDGHHYIKELLERGVRCFVVSHIDNEWCKIYPDAGFICLDPQDNTIAALQRLATHHRDLFSYPVVGITGSNGKTIVKEWLFFLLSRDRRIVRNPKSYNSQIGVPLSVWQMTYSNDLGIFEAGISQPGEMALLETVIKPDIGIFTNIGSAHNSGFKSESDKIQEKLELFNHSTSLIYCSDHESIDKEIRKKWGKKKGNPQEKAPKLFRWSRNHNAELRLDSIEKVSINESPSLTRLQVTYQQKNYSFTIPFTDDASIENAMHCISLMLLMDLTPETIAENTPSLQAVAMRLEIKEGINHCSVINDSYNSDLNSLAIALDFLNSQTRHRNRTLIISDILQTGMHPKELYGQVAALIKVKGVDKLIGIGPDIVSQSDLFIIPSEFFQDTGSFILNYDFSRFHDEAILLKGARPFAFEKLSELLQQKDHQTILEVDLDALIHNLNVFRAHLKEGVKTMGIVKAFSYGSGSIEIASALQYHNIDYLAVAYADEGKELRKGGIYLPIVVMNPEVSNFETLLAYNLEPEIYSLELLKRFAREIDLLSDNNSVITYDPKPGNPALCRGEKFFAPTTALDRPHNPWSLSPSTPLRDHVVEGQLVTHLIHIKLDTGMHRLGFQPDQLSELIDILKKNPAIKVESVFSHFAGSDDPMLDDFSHEQITVFSESCNKLGRALGYNFLRHMSNSAGIIRFPEAHFDMVRLGIGLYGISNLAGMQDLLQHVSTFKSVISQIKHIQQGQSIGYNRRAIAERDMVIAIVPVGYADGLRRQLGNGVGSLMVSGQKRPLVGDISMDMCAIDITGMNVKTGDEVIIFGNERSVAELARDMNTIPYEVLTSVSSRVKRVYYQG